MLSPSTEARDRGETLSIYAAHGVARVWLVDPIRKLLEVHELDPGRRWREVRTYQGNTRVRAAPFEVSELELAALWA